MKRLVSEGKSEVEILAVFTERYNKQGKTDPKWIAHRVERYKKKLGH